MPYAGENLYGTIATLQNQVEVTPRNPTQWLAIVTAAQSVLIQLDTDSKNSTISLDNADSVISILSATLRNLNDDTANANTANQDWIDLNSDFGTYTTSKDGGNTFIFEDSSANIDGKTDDVAYAIKAVEFYGYIVTSASTSTDAQDICNSIVTLETLAVTLTSDIDYFSALAGKFILADEITDAYTKADALLTSVNSTIPTATLDAMTEDADAAAAVSVASLLTLSQNHLYGKIVVLQDAIAAAESFATLVTNATDVLNELKIATSNSTITEQNSLATQHVLKAVIQYLITHPSYVQADVDTLNDDLQFYIGIDYASATWYNHGGSSYGIDARRNDVVYGTKAVEFFRIIVAPDISATNAILLFETISQVYNQVYFLDDDLKDSGTESKYDTDGEVHLAYTAAKALYSESSIIDQTTLSDTAVADAKTAANTAMTAFELIVMTDDGINTIFRFTLPVSSTNVTSSELLDFVSQISEAFHSEVKIKINQSQSGLIFSQVTYSGDLANNDDGKDGTATETTPFVSVHDVWKVGFQGFVDSTFVVDQTRSGSPTYGSENRTALHSLINYLFNVTASGGATIKSDLVVQAGFKNIIKASFDGGGESSSGAKDGVFWSLHNALLNAGRMRQGHVFMETTDMIELVCPIRSDDPDMAQSSNAQANYWNLSVNFLFN